MPKGARDRFSMDVFEQQLMHAADLGKLVMLMAVNPETKRFEVVCGFDLPDCVQVAQERGLYLGVAEDEDGQE